MILVLSNGRDATSDFFEDRLKVARERYLRMNTDCLSEYAVDLRVGDDSVCGTFSTPDGQQFELSAIKSIYYRRPKPPRVSDEVTPALREWVQNEHRKLWGGLLNLYPSCKWVNHPLAISGANYKPEQLARAVRVGLNVPPTLITNDPHAARNFCESHNWRVVVKPIGHGQVGNDGTEQESLIYTNLIDQDYFEQLSSVGVCPTLLQAYVEKVLDLRVTVVERECMAVELHSQERDVSKVDCRRDNMEGMRYTVTQLPADLRSKLVSLTRSYSLHFAAIDMAIDQAGRYWFFELNPAGQWAWLEQQAGAPISDALIRCLRRDPQ